MTDPHGASFAVYTPEGPAPGHDGEAQLREFSWHELATHDYPAAFRFYERLFGWEKSSAMDMGENGTYQMFSRKGVILGGMFNASPQMPAPPDTVRTATRSPLGIGLVVNTAAMVTASSRSLETMKPYLANTAS